MNYQIAELERVEEENMVSAGQELNAMHALASSRNFFNPNINIMEPFPPQSDKKILHLGYLILLPN